MLKKKTAVILLVVQFLAETALVLALVKSNIFPVSYIIDVIIVAAVLLLISWLLAFVSIKNKKDSVIILRRIIATLLAVFMIAASAFSWIVLSKVGNTITGITTKKTVTTAVGVYVSADDPAQTIEDAAHYDFGYAKNYEVKSTLEAIDDIKQKIGNKPDTQEYDDAMEMVQDLYDGAIDAIIMNESYASIVADQEGYGDFASNTKLIYEYKVVTKAEDDGKKPASNHDLSKFVIYLSGSDTTSKMLDVSRSDVNILMAVNTKTKEILLINTPRDYYIPISVSSSGARDKLTHCGIYGVDCSMDSLSALYGHDVDYYAQINFTGFETLIDAVGGVTVYSDRAFTSDDGISFNQGDNYVNGMQALSFARDRDHQTGGDRGRGNNQMKVITAVINKLSAGTVLANYSDILDSLQGMFITDMTSDDINELVKMQLSDMSSWNIHRYAVTGSDGSSTTYSIPGTKAYVMYPDKKTVAHASELMEKVLDGERLTDADLS